MVRVVINARFWNLLADDAVEEGTLAPEDHESLVDTGATETVIPPDLADRLGLKRKGKLPVRYASGQRRELDLAYGLMVQIEDRVTETRAIVEPGIDRPLIGQTVLESLDLWVDCKGRRLISNPEHGSESPIIDILCVVHPMGRLRRARPAALQP